MNAAALLISMLVVTSNPTATELSPHRYLRALSLDLTGTVPSAEQLDRVSDSGEVGDDLVDDLLATDGFVSQVVRLHRDLMWNNVTNLALTTGSVALAQTKSGALFAPLRANLVRIKPEAPCLDQPAEYLPDGSIAMVPGEVDGSPVLQEGWVLVNPYWAPQETIKVCAFDAQEALVSPSGVPCDTVDGMRDPGCGCGPGLRWCHFGGPFTEVAKAFGEDVDRRVADVIAGDRPYTDLFTATTAWVNGPIVHYYKYVTQVNGALSVRPYAFELDDLPDLSWQDEDQWYPIQLPPEHAGILSSPAFLLRFQTNRGRADRFYNAFLCQPFQPPEGGLPLNNDKANQEPDLQKRAGCKYCHAVLEPSAAYWGRWAESGSGYLWPEQYPDWRDDCWLCATTNQACSRDCRRHYLVQSRSFKESQWLGRLSSTVFLSSDHAEHIELGPRKLAMSAVADGRLPRCVVRTAFHWLLGRRMDPSEDGHVEAVTQQFVASGYRYRELVRAIVRSSLYRRVR